MALSKVVLFTLVYQDIKIERIKMKRYGRIEVITFLALFIITGCDNENDSDGEAVPQNTTNTITTSNVNSGDIYLNLDDGIEVSSNDIWHLSIIIDAENYNMPSIVMGDAEVAVYESLNYNNISGIPSDFNSMVIADNNTFKYGGENEVLTYDMTVHKVSVTNPEFIYILKYDTEMYMAFKIQFIEYQSGITVLNYNQLETD